MEEQNKKTIIAGLKAELDDMETKLRKSGSEFKEYYSSKRKAIADLLKQYAHELEQSGEEKIHDLKESSYELLDLLESDYDVSYTEYESKSHKLTTAIEKFESRLTEFLAEAAEKGKSTKKELEADINEKLGKLKTEIDIQKAHLKGTKDRAMTEYESWKKGRLEDIEKLKKELEVKKDEAELKLEEFGGELSQSFDHLKKAFKKLW
jgi:ElaB/YqjD/DUF883 family membrane-anchored ribosome-binding protein